MTAAVIPTRRVGPKGEKVGSLGFGAMGLAAFYGEAAPQETVDAILSECLKLGVTMIDTADVYSPIKLQRNGFNEEQIGRFLKANPGAREKMFLATKFVNNWENGQMIQRGDREYCLQCCEDSLKRLGVDQIDLYYAHRAAPNATIEETVGALKELQDAGKIRYIGVSEYNLDQLERAQKVAPIQFLQIELSPWSPNILTNGILSWCEKNNVTVAAYSPLGRGFLTGAYKSPDDFEEGDFRKHNPRFMGAAFDKNLELVHKLKALADKKKVTAGQISLAWCMSKSPAIIPIPGTKKLKYLDENIAAAHISLSKDEIKEIDAVIDSFQVTGERYPAQMSGALAY